MQLTDYEYNAIAKLGRAIHDGKWSNAGLVELIKLEGDYLNLKTIPRYAKSVGKSYPGVVKAREITHLFDVKWIIDND
ncbi:MAG TPA: hypothetical protein DCR40_18150 [Prolixibacteraceae bacterium]|nr:hypothetical protein [Prolixibacteraceae bacterium]